MLQLLQRAGAGLGTQVLRFSAAQRSSRRCSTENLELVRAIEALAQAKGAASQLALAWVLLRGDQVTAIPGTRSLTRLAENAAAADIALSDEELAQLDAIAPLDAAAGSRYPEASASAGQPLTMIGRRDRCESRSSFSDQRLSPAPCSPC